MESAVSRLLRYVTVNTRSEEESASCPSSARQFDLARILEKELREIGVQDVILSDTCCVYGKIPATKGYEARDVLGFLAHMDTADFPAENVSPRIIENYDGGAVELGNGRTLSPEQFPHLPTLRGKTLIVTDGSTLLGADDKAGVAEIMVLCEKLIAGEIPHGPISVCFTPDEEVGRGTEGFDPKIFGAKYAYTVDGGEVSAIEYETFNACAARMEINGFNVHPGSAKDTMINASLVAMEANAMLPAGETPRNTKDYEGFFHLISIKGDVERATMDYIIRDHSASRFEGRQETLRHVEALINEKYGAGTAVLHIRQQYRNMAEKILPARHLLDNAMDAVREVGLSPFTPPVRGGTDGSALSFMGIPCPNLGTGGWAYHGPYEHITAEDMDTAVEILCGIVRRYGEKNY